SDTDRDHMRDGDELLNSTDPLVPDGPVVDSDGDGISDSAEARYKTNAGSPDMDRDGLPDNYELLLGFDPGNPDTDGDGLLDGWEATPLRYRFLPRQWHFQD